MDILGIIGITAAIVGIVAGVLQVGEYLQKRREQPELDAALEQSAPGQKYLTPLRQILSERFDAGELRTLCFDLGVDYDSLPGRGKANKARELVAYLERRQRISELIELGKRQRPDIGGWAQAQLDVDMEQLRARRDQTDRQRRATRQRQRVVNLRPLDVTQAFRDRQREIHALYTHLADTHACLVSIVGRGGMGKTALACHALAGLEGGVLPVPGEDRELAVDGILYLSARSTGLGLERIYADVGRMLGEPTASKLSVRWASRDLPLAAKIEYLLETLQDGLYLILLDNLEDELTPEGVIGREGLRLFVERCLTMPGGARLIVTSREQVKISPAALRGARSIPLREGLPEDEAIALLRDLDPSGTLGLRDGAQDDLHRAARLTQGIPRALEILAGILHEDPAASLPRLLADEGLFGEQVVEQLVAEGYRRLGEDERRVMEALAVFDLPVEETAVAYLLHPWFPDLDVRSCLRRLVSGYFVSASRVTGEYGIHPLDRDYAYRQLSNDGEANAYTRCNLELRAADFYASIRKPESEWKSIEDLVPQLAEFEHRVRAGDYDGAGWVLSPLNLNYLLYLQGHYVRLVEMREKLLGQLTDPSLRASNQGWLGRAYLVLGHASEAVAHFEHALDIFREIGNQPSEPSILNSLGIAYRYLGQVEREVECDEQALVIAREIGNRRAEEYSLGNLGNAYRALGQTARAIDYYEKALTIARETGNRAGEGSWLGCMGVARRDLGQVEQAIKLYKEALGISHEIGYRLGESYQLLGLGRALLATGELSQARQHCEKARDLNMSETSYQAVLVLGIVLLHQRDLAAGEIFTSATARCQTMLDKTAGLYAPRYALAGALVGIAVCDPRWVQESKRAELLTPTLTEYRRALENCAAPGVVAEALRDLELIQAAGIEGLEPVFELLKSAADRLADA
jgi:tetratricopeptide (TPR) repeat protein